MFLVFPWLGGSKTAFRSQPAEGKSWSFVEFVSIRGQQLLVSAVNHSDRARAQSALVLRQFALVRVQFVQSPERPGKRLEHRVDARCPKEKVAAQRVFARGQPVGAGLRSVRPCVSSWGCGFFSALRV